MSSMLAAQLILHPQLTKSLKLLATTVGRDKTYRLIQYLARLVAWSLLRSGGVEAKDAAARWNGLKAGLASGRKMLRLVKPLEHLQTAITTANTPVKSSSLAPVASNVAQLAQIARQLCYAGYLSTDMIVWLQSVKFLRIRADKFARISTISQRFWLGGILLSLLSSSASMFRLRTEGRRLALSRTAEKSGPEDQEARRAEGRALLKERASLISQLTLDCLDVWIPATNLGYAHLNDGAIGAIGVVTSYIGLQQQWIKVHGLPAGKGK
ncbi:hypothetical protein NliqN6_0037 [Naganishia liquefaciens]|uniref:Peroxisomal biogenesis factor 11 n=1 Tax=Naganishia liquefaciens TaxID=104408 RepID=A0A8H3YBW2_9TREE|nr:hypothetical protein NliqN6_0037 [Naganishia liquefaciens]